MKHSEKSVDNQQKEMAISMTALHFVEEHALLSQDQLSDAKKSLQALFLRTSGEESMLRKLIDTLKTTRLIHQSFASIAGVLKGISQGVKLVDGKITAYKNLVESMQLTAEENVAFAGPFLTFSNAFLDRIEVFDQTVHQYVDLRESEARHASIHQIANEAREHLKRRLKGVLGAEAHGEAESKIRKSVIASFDFNEAESNLRYAERETRYKGEEIVAQLEDIKTMCQMAKNPAMREKSGYIPALAITPNSIAPDHELATSLKPMSPYVDVFTLFTAALPLYPRLLEMKGIVLELFKLYQHSYGMLSLDCANLHNAIETMLGNSEAYFEAKEEDQDIRSKREKLQKIEGLIPFLERAAVAVNEDPSGNYSKFSRKISDIISEKKTHWEHITEDLLRAKVQAEAELSTRM